MKRIKVVVEQPCDGYVAYPLGLKGIVVGKGDTREAALADVGSAIRFHVETFGDEVLSDAPEVLDATLAEAINARAPGSAGSAHALQEKVPPGWRRTG